MFRRFKKYRAFRRLFKKKPEPKIKIRSRTRINGWVVCECKECKCHKPSRWEDRQCVDCWRGRHTAQRLNTEKESE